MLLWKGKKSQGPTSRQRTTGNYWLLGDGKLALPRHGLPYRLSKAKWSSLKPYTPRHHKWTLQVIYIHTYIFYIICAYRCDIYNQRKIGLFNLTLKWDVWSLRKGNWEWLEGDTGEGSDIILFKLKTFLNEIKLNKNKTYKK